MRIECPKCEARIHVSEDDEKTRVVCPKCGAKVRLPQDDDDEDEAPKSKKGKKAGRRDRGEDEKKFPMVPVIGGAVAVLAIVGVVIAVVVSKGDKKKETAKTEEVKKEEPAVPPGGFKPMPGKEQPPPPKPNPKVDPPFNPPPPKNDGKIDNEPKETLTGPYADLFKADIPPHAPPTVRAAGLKPTSEDKEPDIPSFHSLMMARKEGKTPATTVAPKGAKMTLDELKKASAYIKVETAAGGASGSGFLISANGSTGLVATNHHVIAEAVEEKFGNISAKVSVVFNSGLADEHSHKADVVAFDPIADVAILRIQSAKEWPKVLNPYNTPAKLNEGTSIHFYGFPLGGGLSSSKRNPEISVGNASIASFRHNDAGKLDRIQISGTLNHGNSGGPIVDDDGRLVGIAVSIIRTEIATGIGFAVPVADLIALLEGKVLGTHFLPLSIEKDQATFLAFSFIMDPMDRVDTVFLRRWVGVGKPPPFVKDPLTGFKPFAMRADGKANLPGVEEFSLKKLPPEPDDPGGLGIALGEMTVPLDSEQILIQLASQTQANPQTGIKYTAASKPVPFTMSIGDAPVASDVRPFSELTANPDGLAGRVVVVRARVAAPPITRDLIQDLIITDVDGKKAPDRMKFLVSREMAAQFDEVEREHQPMPVRLVCLMGQRGVDGILPVRISRVDFISRQKRIVRTIPAAPIGGLEDLARLNRDPQRFAGQTVTLNCNAVPITKKTKGIPDELGVAFGGGMPPRNLKFGIANSMFLRMVDKLGSDLRPDGLYRSRITVVVPKTLDASKKAPLTVTKLELLGPEDKVIATFE